MTSFFIYLLWAQPHTRPTAAAAAAQFRIAHVCKIIVSYLHKAQYKICKIFTSTIFSVT